MNTFLFLYFIHKDDKTFLRPSAVVADSKDNIYVKDDLCVQIFDTYGRHLKTIGMKIFRCPYGELVKWMKFILILNPLNFSWNIRL